EERTAGDVAAVQGYCLAARRADLVAAGGVQEAFTWYRNADIDVSLRLRTLDEPPVRRGGARGRRRSTPPHTRRAGGPPPAAANPPPRHTHRAWEATPEPERGERSRRNMAVVHEVFF